MYELKDDVFYEVLKRYPEIRVDYCLLKNEGPYRGEETHRLALAFRIPAGPGLCLLEDEAGGIRRVDL